MTENKKLIIRVIKGGVWIFSSHILSQIIRLASNLILTRLLVPEMFGVMAIVTVIMMGMIMLSDIGIRQSIIKSHRGEERVFLNTAWTIGIIKGALLCIVMILFSYSLGLLNEWDIFKEGSVYADPVLPEVLIAMSLILFVNGFLSTKLYVKNRNLEMGKVSFLELISQMLGVMIMIVVAMNTPTIWALVFGAIVTALLKVILSHVMFSGVENRLCWDAESFSEIFHFGKWMLLSSLLSFLTMQGDRIILGSLVSAQVLGVYTIAYFIAEAVNLVVRKINGSVLFPAYSEIVRENVNELADTYYKFRKRVDVVSFFLAGLLFESGSELIALLYDERYADAGWMLEIMAFLLFFSPFLLAGQCFIAMGKPKYHSSSLLIQLATVYISLPLCYYLYGLQGAVWALALSTLPRVGVTLMLMRRLKLLNIKKEVLYIPVLVAGVVSGWLLNWARVA